MTLQGRNLLKRFSPPLCAALLAMAALVELQTPARAEPLSAGSELPTARRISMGIGKSVIVDLPQDAAEIFVGNPKVANAVVRSARKLYIIGMENGQTTVFAMDQQGRQIAALEISVGRDTGALQQILRTALPDTTIIARTVNDTIILTGTVDSAEEAQRAYDIAKGFVKQTSSGGVEGIVINSVTIRGRDQVMLKVTVAEIRRDISKQLGITSSTWGSFNQVNPFGIQGSIATSTSGAVSTGGATGLNLKNPTNTLNATLNAFERYGVARTLAEPTVSAVSGESAKFTVGGQIPLPGAPICSATASGSTVCTPGGAMFKDYGVTLNFAPVVLAEGRILLHLATEVTEIDYSKTVTIESVPVPGLRTRKNETTVEIPSGGSIATAGLLQTTSAQIINGTPGLMNLPILGTLFRSRDYQRQETELMVIVTPYIIKSTVPREFAKPDDGFSDSSDPQAWLLGRMNRLYSTPNNPQAINNYKGRVGFIQD